MEIVSIILAVIVGIIVLVLLFRPFFGNAQGFFDCITFWFTPDILSLLLGKYFVDSLSQVKLFIWLLCGIGAGVGTYYGLMRLFG